MSLITGWRYASSNDLARINADSDRRGYGHLLNDRAFTDIDPDGDHWVHGLVEYDYKHVEEVSLDYALRKAVSLEGSHRTTPESVALTVTMFRTKDGRHVITFLDMPISVYDSLPPANGAGVIARYGEDEFFTRLEVAARTYFPPDGAYAMKAIKAIRTR